MTNKKKRRKRYQRRNFVLLDEQGTGKTTTLDILQEPHEEEAFRSIWKKYEVSSF